MSPESPASLSAALQSLRTAASSDRNRQHLTEITVSHITPFSQPTRQERSTIPPNTSGHKATFQGKATKELSISPLGEAGAPRTVQPHHARVSKTCFRGVGTPFTCLSSVFHPATVVTSFPPALSLSPSPAAQDSRPAAPASLPSPQPPGSACASSRRGLPGAAGLSVTLRPVPMALGLGAHCLPAEGDLPEERKEGKGRRKGQSLYPLNGGECVSGIGVGLLLL